MNWKSAACGRLGFLSEHERHTSVLHKITNGKSGVGKTVEECQFKHRLRTHTYTV